MLVGLGPANALFMDEISTGLDSSTTFYKQRNFFFFPAWAYSIPLWILKIPASVVEVAAFTLLTYYEIGFDPNFGR